MRKYRVTAGSLSFELGCFSRGDIVELDDDTAERLSGDLQVLPEVAAQPQVVDASEPLKVDVALDTPKDAVKPLGETTKKAKVKVKA